MGRPFKGFMFITDQTHGVAMGCEWPARGGNTPVSIERWYQLLCRKKLGPHPWMARHMDWDVFMTSRRWRNLFWIISDGNLVN
jgi:hypothetical protein